MGLDIHMTRLHRALRAMFRFEPFEERTPLTWFITSTAIGFLFTLGIIMAFANRMAPESCTSTSAVENVGVGHGSVDSPILVTREITCP